MTLATCVTLSRVGLTFVVVISLAVDTTMSTAIAWVAFLVAAATDALDGWVARRRQETTRWGVVLDPLADKVLVLGTLAALVEGQWMPAWMLLLFLTREWFVTALRLHAAGEGRSVAPSQQAKIKTAAQLVTLGVVLAALLLRRALIDTEAWSFAWDRGLYTGMVSSLGIVLLVTWWTAWQYLCQWRIANVSETSSTAHS